MSYSENGIAVPTPTPSSTVSFAEAHQMLDDSISQINETVHLLAEKLDPLLRAPNDGKAISESPVGTSSLAQARLDQNDQLSRIWHRLRDLTHRVDL